MTARFQSYVICTSPRSGSTLLCRLLQGTGVAGVPGSHFHKPALDAWLSSYDLRTADYPTHKARLGAVFAAARAVGTGTTDIFGLRLQGQSRDYFLTQLRILYPSCRNDQARFDATFGKTLFIHLTREDKVDQTVSYVRAQQSGLWHQAPDGTEIERLSAPQDPVYDADVLASQVAAFEQMDADWQTWFAAENIEPLRITYATLSAAPFETLDRVLDALGIAAVPHHQMTLPTAKLADAINQDWATRFRAETPG